MSRTPKILVGFLLLAALAAITYIEAESMGGTPVWLRFLGRFHPVVLHLPIGLFAGVVLLEVAALTRVIERKADIIRLLVLASFLSASVAATSGALLSWEGGYNEEMLANHKWSGLAICALFAILYISLSARSVARPSPVYWSVFVASVATLGWAGHQGGSLTHGSTFLTEHMPFKSRPVEVALGPDAPIFDTHISPLLRDYCVQCHGPEKVKGELRMDSFEGLKAGGVSGAAMLAGDSAHSRFIQSMLLPNDHADRMPPVGKPQPKPDELALLRWWIDQGADPDAKLADLRVTPAVAHMFIRADSLEILPRSEIEPRIAALASHKSRSVSFIAKDDPRLRVSLRQATDADVEALLPLKNNLIRLDLARSAITDRSARAIGQMLNLQSLHLEHTGVTDQGIEALTGLGSLEFLNLYGTAITDASIVHLRRLSSLRRVFLWQTGVTQEAAASLERALYPELEADRFRQQIEDLVQASDRLKVAVVGGFPTLVDPELPEDGGFNISDFMRNFHRGDDSLASRARIGDAEDEELDVLLRNYQDLATAQPPRGDPDSWREKTTSLIQATEALIAHTPDALMRYTNALNCQACHDKHR